MTIYLKQYQLADHQVKGAEFLLNNKKAILVIPMGGRKTATTILAIKTLLSYDKNAKILVVCRSILKQHWKNEIEKFSDISYSIADGSFSERLKSYNKNATITIINHDILLSSNDFELLKSKFWDVIVNDEVVKIKNYKNKTSKSLRQLRSFYRWVLTGAPLENRLEELFSIMTFVDPTIFGSYWDFRSKYLVTQEVHGFRKTWTEIVGYKNIDDLKSRLKTVMFQVSFDEISFLYPEKMEKIYSIDMTKEQKELYEIMKNEAKTLLHTNQNPLAKLMYLRQISNDLRTAFPSLVGDKYVGNKIREISDLIENDLYKENVLVFTNFKKFAYLIADHLSKIRKDVMVLSGDLNTTEKNIVIDKFRNHGGILISTEVGSYGLDFQHNCHIVINASIGYNPKTIEQQIFRVYRSGQMNKVIVINILSKGSVDEKVYEIIQKKNDLINMVMKLESNDFDIQNNKEFIEYLLS